MNKYNWTLIKELVDTAIDLPPGKRVSFIETHSGVSEDAKMEAVSLLQAIESSEGLWDKLLLTNQIIAEDLTNSDSLADISFPSTIPKSVGPYSVIAHIASGGMGDVVLAEKADGQIKRNVAIKILRRELQTPENTARFIQERDILSGLNHPNIARLYDGGITEDGRPYLVLEYVDGLPIDKFCREKTCPTEYKLRLFYQICRAVKYAHGNLVVHRDLKPGNIFVTSNNSVKILDFGIAKIIDTELSEDQLIQTGKGARLLSIQYAAPEQVMAENITTSTDIYALGLLLYELLTGCKPFELSGKKIAEAERIIRYQSPGKPSAATNNNTLKKKISGDLDAIILKMLRKSPADRYQSVEEVLYELDRYQAKKPVQARRGSFAYKSKKFIERQKVPLSIALLLLFTVSALLVYHFKEVNSQKNLAQEKQQQAEIVTSFMTDLFESADPLRNVDDTLTVYDLLERGKERVDGLKDDFPAKPALIASLAGSYQNLGSYDQAEILYQQAYRLLESRPEDKHDLLDMTYQFGSMHVSQRNYTDAAFYFDSAVKLDKELNTRSSLLSASIYTSYGNTVAELGNSELAIIFLNNALSIHEKLKSSIREKRQALINLAKAYRHNKNYKKSEELYRKILADIENSDYDHQAGSSLGGIYNNLAYLLKVQDKYDEAIYYYYESLQLHEKLYGRSHPLTLMIINNLASAYDKTGETKKVKELLQTGIERTEEQFGNTHWRTATSFRSLGIHLFRNEQPDEAEIYFREAFKRYSQNLGPEHLWTAVTEIYLAACIYLSSEKSISTSMFENAYMNLYKKKNAFTSFDKQLLSMVLNDIERYELREWDGKIELLKKMI